MRQQVSVIQVICSVCGQDFLASRSDALYCSPACRARARRLRDASRVECPGCRSSFVPSRTTQRYCCPECRQRAERRRRYRRQREAVGQDVAATGARSGRPADELRPCLVCRTPFRPSRSSQRYCSATCRKAAANIVRSRGSLRTPAATACQTISRLHAPDLRDMCAECSRPWPCETYRIASSSIRL